MFGSDDSRGILEALRDPAAFSAYVLGRRLRWYQAEPLRAIVQSVAWGQGLTFVVMFGRQMGKNEMSAHLECLLMNLHATGGGTIVKAAPTFKPQVIVSKTRLDGLLANRVDRGVAGGSWGYISRLGKSRTVFFSGEKGANVVGETADVLLEIDEAQDFDAEKYQRDFRPMASARNATTVLYGTAWSEDDLLAVERRRAEDAQAADGRRRVFVYDWHALARISPQYRRFVENERARLGVAHPLFQSQYELKAIPGAGRLFGPADLAQLQGDHRRGAPADGELVAGLDLAGSGADRSWLILAEIERREIGMISQSVAKVVQVYVWEHIDDLAALQVQLADILARVHPVQRLAVDATGLGAGVASFLSAALPGRVEEVVITEGGKSRLGFDLLAAVGSGRLRVFADDGSAESALLWDEVRECRRELVAGRLMRWSAPSGVHDDAVAALALVVRALGEVSAVAPAAEVWRAPDILTWR